jgi:RNA-directed DNA polymerase
MSSSDGMSPTAVSGYAWNATDWKRTQQRVFKLQKRIYRASQRGDQRATHRLQQLLVKSQAAKQLAVRRVTQDNTGKRTAGIDGKTALTPPERQQLVEHLRLPSNASPLRRVWVPKPGKTERRPLGIPTIADRAAQALAKLALEPEWEAKFEPNSYGFRPGRSTQDAIKAVRMACYVTPKYILDADIAKCFDRIDHEALLAKLATYPRMRRAIRAWLKAGAMEGLDFTPTEMGAPQGAIISPLLANVALHGLEHAIANRDNWGGALANGHRRRPEVPRGWDARVVRYADDFVVIHRDVAALHWAQRIIGQFLANLGLELSPTKTRIVHTQLPYNGQPAGFDFLGCEFRTFPVGKTHRWKRAGTEVTGMLIVRPSKAALKRHHQDLRRAIAALKDAPQAAVIAALNRKIPGWTRYYRSTYASESFATADLALARRLIAWSWRRHPRKSKGYARRQYWRGSNFTDGQSRLTWHDATKIAPKYTKVTGSRSPYDGDWAYWGQRLANSPLAPTRINRLLKRQQGRCASCGLKITTEDLVQVDHIEPSGLGGSNAYGNLQLIHKHCHDQKTARDLQRMREVRNDNATMTEEPDAAKVASPVLEGESGRRLPG